MSRNFLIFPVFVLLFAIGCSGGSNTPVVPTNPGQAADLPAVETAGSEVIMAGTMNLEDGSVDFSKREATAYLDVTGILGSNFQYFINGVIPPDIIDLTLQINNPSTIIAYDVLVVFEKLYGKEVVNADGMIDIFGPYDLDPFIAFQKDDAMRKFPTEIDTQPMLLHYPVGASPFVDFFIIAHLGGSTGGVYELNNWNVTGQLTPLGGLADLSVDVLDWQEDIDTVVADTTPLTGGHTPFAKGSGLSYIAQITNSMGAPEGEYPTIVLAHSPAAPDYNTYNIFPIMVTTGGSDLEAIITTVPDPAVITQGDLITFDAAESNGPNPIVEYNWDMDGDGLYDDSTGVITTYYICEPGDTLVGLQVIDDTLDEAYSDVLIQVSPDMSPITGWGTDIKVADSSHEPFVCNVTQRAIVGYENHLYAIFNDSNLTSFNIFFVESPDLGVNWSTPLQITNYDPVDNVRAEYANLWVDGNTGDIYVRYDCNNGTAFYEVYIIRSQDGGQTWDNPTQVNPDTPGISNQHNGCIVIDDNVDPARIYIKGVSPQWH